MRSDPRDYVIISPKNLKEALSLMQSTPSLKPLAGGTDLMVLFEAGKLKYKNLLNLSELKDFKKIEVTKNEIRIGSLVTYSEIQDHKVIQKEFPLLINAASLTGARAIQNRGTLGGNIMNASPAADTPPALLAYTTELELMSQNETRKVPYEKFHLDYKKMNAKPHELLSKIILKRTSQKLVHFYRKVGTRKAQAISKVCFAGTGKVIKGKFQHIQIGLGSIAPVPFQPVKTMSFLLGRSFNSNTVQEAKSILQSEISPLTDIRSTQEYRLQVTLNLLEEYLTYICGTGLKN